MHQEGLALEKHDGSCSYLFSKTRPSDMTYRKAYKEFNSEDEKKAYIQVFEDSGWEYIDEKKNFYYFRSAGNSLETLIDEKTKYEIFHKSLASMVIPLIILLFLAMLPKLINLMFVPSEFMKGFVDGVSTVVSLVFTVIIIPNYSPS